VDPPVEREADDGSDREQRRSAAEEGDHSEAVNAGGGSLAREPPGETDIPAGERVVRQVILGDPREGDCRESGRRQRKGEPPLSRGHVVQSSKSRSPRVRMHSLHDRKP